MIYIENSRELQTISIPIGYSKGVGGVKLLLRSTIDLTNTIIEVQDEKKEGIYYVFTFALPDGLQAGEYIYRVMQNDYLLTEGLAVLKYAPQEIFTNNDEIHYEQYEG